MIVHLPDDLESSILAVVEDGHFASIDEAMAEAARLLIKQVPAARKPRSEQEFLQNLLDIGLISSLPNKANDFEVREYQPIDIEGEPLSETIIRERR